MPRKKEDESSSEISEEIVVPPDVIKQEVKEPEKSDYIRNLENKISSLEGMISNQNQMFSSLQEKISKVTPAETSEAEEETDPQKLVERIAEQVFENKKMEQNMQQLDRYYSNLALQTFPDLTNRDSDMYKEWQTTIAKKRKEMGDVGLGYDAKFSEEQLYNFAHQAHTELIRKGKITPATQQKWAWDRQRYNREYLARDGYLEGSGGYYQDNKPKKRAISEDEKMLAKKLGVDINKIEKQLNDKK